MGSFSVLNNISSLNGQNKLNINNINLFRTLQRLSSGKRINSGADDAAGLQIADSLRGNVYALNQAMRNASDGIGFCQIADGACSTITDMLNRMVTLAEEAVSDIISSEGRAALDTEFQQIQAELVRIALDTNYNGMNIFDRSERPEPPKTISTTLRTIAEPKEPVTKGSIGDLPTNIPDHDLLDKITPPDMHALVEDAYQKANKAYKDVTDYFKDFLDPGDLVSVGEYSALLEEYRLALGYTPPTQGLVKALNDSKAVNLNNENIFESYWDSLSPVLDDTKDYILKVQTRLDNLKNEEIIMADFNIAYPAFEDHKVDAAYQKAFDARYEVNKLSTTDFTKSEALDAYQKALIVYRDALINYQKVLTAYRDDVTSQTDELPPPPHMNHYLNNVTNSGDNITYYFNNITALIDALNAKIGDVQSYAAGGREYGDYLDVFVGDLSAVSYIPIKIGYIDIVRDVDVVPNLPPSFSLLNAPNITRPDSSPPTGDIDGTLRIVPNFSSLDDLPDISDLQKEYTEVRKVFSDVFDYRYDTLDPTNPGSVNTFVGLLSAYQTRLEIFQSNLSEYLSTHQEYKLTLETYLYTGAGSLKTVIDDTTDYVDAAQGRLTALAGGGAAIIEADGDVYDKHEVLKYRNLASSAYSDASTSYLKWATDFTNSEYATDYQKALVNYRTALYNYQSAVMAYRDEAEYPDNKSIANDRVNTISSRISQVNLRISGVQNYMQGGRVEVGKIRGINTDTDIDDPKYDPKGTDLYTIDLLTAENALRALEKAKACLSEISIMRGTIGAGMNRLQSAINVLGVTSMNTLAAESNIRDANTAEEITNLTKFQIIAQTGMAALSHANTNAQNVLYLLQ